MTSWMVVPLLALGPGQLYHDDVVKPSDYAPCGLNSFYLVCRMLDAPVDWPRAKELLGEADAAGMHSFQDIARAANAVGLHPVGLKAAATKLAGLPMPAIVHVRNSRRSGQPPHLLVLLRADAREVVLLDPPAPAYSLPTDDFATAFTGNVLVFPPSAEEAARLQRGAWATVVAPAAVATAACFATLAFGTFILRRRARSFVGLPAWVRRAAAVVCLAALSLASVAGVVYAVLPRERVARCVIPQSEVDLGELDPGTFQTHVTVRNDGTAPLRITGVRSSCTCAKAAAPDQIEPGEAGRIVVDLNIGRGPQQARLVVQSDDPAGDIKVTLWWHARSRPVLHPIQNVATAPSDEPYRKTLKILYPGGDKALRPKLVKVECDSPHVSVREGEDRPTAKVEAGGRTFGELDLHLNVTPPGPNAQVNTACHVTVRQGDQSYRLGFVLSVHFLGGDITPEAGGLVFAAASPQALAGQTRTLRVTTRAKPDEVEVIGLPAWLTCETQATGAEFSLRFKLTGAPESSFTQHTIYLSCKGRPRTKVPVTVHCVTP
jgi:hypothetical protein